MSNETRSKILLHKPDGKIEMYFHSEEEAKNRAWEHWREINPDSVSFPNWTQEQVSFVINSWKQTGFPSGYYVSYSMSEAAYFDETQDDYED